MFKIKHDPGNQKALYTLKNQKSGVKTGINVGFKTAGRQLVRRAGRQMLARDKTGRLYRIDINGQTISHRASRPGQSLANLTGNARRSLGSETRGGIQMEFGARQGYEGADYFADWESETTPQRIRRRTLERAVKAEQGNTQTILTTAIKSKLLRVPVR
jgi:hypothetical protein